MIIEKHADLIDCCFCFAISSYQNGYALKAERILYSKYNNKTKTTLIVIATSDNLEELRIWCDIKGIRLLEDILPW